MQIDTLSKNSIDYTKEQWAELQSILQTHLNKIVLEFEQKHLIQPILKLEGTFNSKIEVDFFNREKMTFDKPLSESKEKLENYIEHIKDNH
ncbi:hypothetical protein EV196_1164 [Mariniflexile fucanivorans]|uniref:Uncharacterized protein n=1 Tax=Mariniflexile fucanivorans TaxID=264023 RepID=A0A4R1R987_9FLAO|nr:hypothetical protein [Mariniflexile fucanivorans]TCL62130.1 hypothetical protein EV196_1164 [Mariniflexile fucanivorans]